MNLEELPMGTLRAGVERLVATFGAPKDIKPDAFLSELQRALRGWRMAEFDAAVSAAIAEERFFPRIAVIRKHRPPQVGGEERPMVGVGNVCAACGSHDYYAGFQCGNGVVMPRLRCDCPSAGSGWDTPAALAWEEHEPKILGTPFHRAGLGRAA